MADQEQVEGITGEEASQTPEALFHTYTTDDGQEHKFKNPDELNTFIRQGAMRQADYTDKTKALADLRRGYETKQQELERRTQTLLERESKYNQYNEFLNKRPEVGQYIEQNMRNQNPDAILQQAQGYADNGLAELKKQQEELRAWQEEQDSIRERESLLDQMSKTLSDFDRDAVSKGLTSLQEAPPGDTLRTLIEILHYSNLGRKTPVEIEQKLAADKKRKAESETPLKPGATVKASKGGNKYKDFQEAKLAAMKEYAEEA
jgi:hypothetical protein